MKEPGEVVMSNPQSVFQLACQIHDSLGIPVFPVKISYHPDTGKWEKRPLSKWGTGSGNPRELVWQGANAVGVPMGLRSGLIAIDLDDYKKGSQAGVWLRGHKIPATRIHGTASGGRHMIFRLPDGMDFGNHAPDVAGLDIRGSGGFIVWADMGGHYSALVDTVPAVLPESICKELSSRKKTASGPHVTDANLPNFEPVDTTRLVQKLDVALSAIADPGLLSRFEGCTVGLKDKSRSGMDMSLAALLAARGFDFNEIVQTLLEHYQHGTAGRDGWTRKTERAARRCAAQAIQKQTSKETAQMDLLIRTVEQSERLQGLNRRPSNG